MRLLLISSSYPPVLGGLQTVAHTLAQRLNSQGHNVQVVTNRYPRSLPRREMLDGVPVERLLFLWPTWSYLRRRRIDLFLASCFFGPITLFRLWSILRTFRPDVVNVHFPDGQNPFLLILFRLFNFRLVVSLHGDDILRWARNAAPDVTNDSGLQNLRSILKRADAVTACSQWLLNKAVELEPSIVPKGYVVHNGVDLQRFQDRTTYRHSRPYILSYGRLIYDKGYDLLLAAFAQVSTEFQNVDLLIAGSGEEKSSLERWALEMGLDGRVHMCGQATPEEIVGLLNGCSLVVLPSRRETFGIVALEALAAGKPVLATKVGGLPEVLGEGKTVKMVEPTVDGLAAGLHDYLMHLDELRQQGEQNRQRAAHFTWERMIEEYLSVFQGRE